MSKRQEDDGIPDNKLAGAKGYAAVVAFITLVFGGPIVDVVVETTDRRRDVLDQRVEDLEKTVYLMEKGLLNTDLMCSSSMRLVSTTEDVDDEDVSP